MISTKPFFIQLLCSHGWATATHGKGRCTMRPSSDPPPYCQNLTASLFRHFLFFAAGAMLERDNNSGTEEHCAASATVAVHEHHTDDTIHAAWTMYVAPTADDKSCPIAVDNSHESEQQTWLKSWVDQGPGGLKERSKRGTEALGRLTSASGTLGAAQVVLHHNTRPSCNLC